jgi:RNA polymerase sigma-70 factor, ECF subfamily
MIHAQEPLQHRDALTLTDPTGQCRATAACRTHFEALVLPHLPALLRLAQRFTHEATLAPDLVQETLLRAYRSVHRFEPGTHFWAWLATIMRNVYISQWRKKAWEMALDRMPDLVAPEAHTAVEEPQVTHLAELTAMLTHLVNDDVFQALQSLPKDLRTAILMADMLEYSYADIATYMDCPLGTVMSRLHRARQKLRDRLQPYAMAQGYIQSVSTAGTLSLGGEAMPQPSGISHGTGANAVAMVAPGHMRQTCSSPGGSDPKRVSSCSCIPEG